MWTHERLAAAYTPRHTSALLHVGHIIKGHQLAMHVSHANVTCICAMHVCTQWSMLSQAPRLMPQPLVAPVLCALLPAFTL